jgi:hypothetical protein
MGQASCSSRALTSTLACPTPPPERSGSVVTSRKWSRDSFGSIAQPILAETGKPSARALALYLTPAPDGPLGEKWGPFPLSFQVVEALGLETSFGGGGFWSSVTGNEQGGAVFRRDFAMVKPQYVLGKNRGNGSRELYGVMPDGSVSPQISAFGPTLTQRSLDVGAPHWCNEFNSSDDSKRTACRNFVRSQTTMQSIETFEHGMGYMHAPEPRVRYHYDGQLSSIERLRELKEDPSDIPGLLLHQMANQYTTMGVSTVWGQSLSEWNGVGPQTGLQTTMYRSHAREEMEAAESHLDYAIEKYENGIAPDRRIRALIDRAVEVHSGAIKLYDRWEYKQTIRRAMRVLSITDRALTRMGEPDRIHDPLDVIKP